MKFINDKFLLHNRTAQRLYQRYAEPEPIFDFHCHLPPSDIAENRQFKNLFEIWLEGDHYKWRAMRGNGVSEDYCTGTAEPFDKFRAWAATVPHTLRNPLYHWTHLELSRYFGIDELLDEASAARIWKEANRQLATPALSAQGILKKFRVTALCTTDDPADDLRAHEKIAASGLATGVYPAFRPDKSLLVEPARPVQRLAPKPRGSLRPRHRLALRPARRPGEPSSIFSRPRLPPLRPRPQPLFRVPLRGQDRGGNLRAGAQGQGRVT